MHALATAKAGSLGDELYVAISRFVEIFSEGLNRPKMAVFHPFVQRQSVRESLRRSRRTN